LQLLLHHPVAYAENVCQLHSGDYAPSRSQRVPMRLLEWFSGYLQTDGYKAYKKVCDAPGLVAVGCWARVRRKFDEALKAQQVVSPAKHRHSLAASALKQIQALYRIERELKSLTPTTRQRAGQSRSVPLLNDFRLLIVPLNPSMAGCGKWSVSGRFPGKHRGQFPAQ
jgi:hypothetical protein